MTFTANATPDESGNAESGNSAAAGRQSEAAAGHDTDSHGTNRHGPEEVAILTLPASGAYVAILRTTTAGIAARLGFGLDAIEDLRIGVDEACTLLLSESPREITCGFSSDGLGVTIVMSMRPAAAEQHEDSPRRWRETFAWQVLTSLTDDVAVDESAGQLAIRLRKDFV